MDSPSRSASVAERAISQGQLGQLDPSSVLWTIAASAVVIVNDGEPSAGEFPDAPLVVARDGQHYLAVFTDVGFAVPFSDGRVPVQVPAFELLRRVPTSAGLVVNPGNPLGLEVPADGLHAFVSRLLEPIASDGGVTA